MQNDNLDRSELSRLADDGCPHAPERDTGAHDPTNLWAVLGKDDTAAR